MVDHHRVLDNGEPQPSASRRFGAAFVHPVKPLENALLLVQGNADAGIAHGQQDSVLLLLHIHSDASPSPVILDGVVAEIVHHTVQQLRDPLQGSGPAGEG